MSDNRTPDPAAQVVANALLEAWLDADPGFTWPNSWATAECAVAALREAGHIKNLRQVEGWRFNLDVHREEADCDADPPCSHLFVEEGEQ